MKASRKDNKQLKKKLQKINRNQKRKSKNLNKKKKNEKKNRNCIVNRYRYRKKRSSLMLSQAEMQYI